MNKKQFALVALSIVALAVAFVVSFSAANSPTSQKWEYLAVTPGKVYWSSVASKAKDTGCQEAIELEQLLDKLGQQGWELVSIVGLIGGDQEFVFKRPIR
jgi:hypothetical protein